MTTVSVEDDADMLGWGILKDATQQAFAIDTGEDTLETFTHDVTRSSVRLALLIFAISEIATTRPKKSQRQASKLTCRPCEDVFLSRRFNP